MTTYNRKQGDVKDTLVITVEGDEDLTTVSSVEVQVARRRVTRDAATLVAAILSASDRTVVVRPDEDGTGWMSTARGTYRMWTIITFADGRIFTWPSKGHDTLVIQERG